MMLVETFIDPDTIAAIRLGFEPGYHQVEIVIDGKPLGAHGWLLENEEGPVDAYHYSEVLTASIEASEELVKTLASGEASEVVAIVRILGVEDPRTFDVRGAADALILVVDACQG